MTSNEISNSTGSACSKVRLDINGSAPTNKKKREGGTKTMLRVKYRSFKRKVKGKTPKRTPKGTQDPERQSQAAGTGHNPDISSSLDHKYEAAVRDISTTRESAGDVDNVIVIQNVNGEGYATKTDEARATAAAPKPANLTVNNFDNTRRISRRRTNAGGGSLIANPAIVNGHYVGRGNIYRTVGRTLAEASEGRKKDVKKDDFTWCGCMGQRSKQTGMEAAQAAEPYKLTPSGASLRLNHTTSSTAKQSTLFTDIGSRTDYDICHKILLLGDSNVGKTSILRRMMKKPFNPEERATVAFDFVTQLMNVDGARVMLQIWDLPGQDRFNTLVKHYYNDTKAVVLVYDITDMESFIFLGDKWLNKIEKEIDKDDQEGVPVYIVGNKFDKEECYHDVTVEQGEQFCEHHVCNGFFGISAKTGEGVKEMFEKVALDVTEIYSPKLMNSYLSPTERAEKYRVMPNGGLGTAQIVEAETVEGPGVTQPRKVGGKHQSPKSRWGRGLFCSCLPRSEE